MGLHYTKSSMAVFREDLAYLLNLERAGLLAIGPAHLPRKTPCRWVVEAGLTKLSMTKHSSNRVASKISGITNPLYTS